MVQTKTEEHKRKILEILRTQGTRGINSKFLIQQVTPRYSARINDLKREGYYFKTKRERIGGSNFIRLWLLTGPQEPTKPICWEFDADTNTARPIFG